MKLWRRLIGKETAGEREARVAAAVESCASSSDARRALRRLARIGRSAPDLVGFEGALHGPFRSAVGDAWRRVDPERFRRPLLAVAARQWSSWPVATVADLAAWAREEQVETLALLEEEGRAGRDAMLQLTAVRMLAGDERLAMVVIDDAELFVRRKFVLQAGSAARGDVEEVIRELADGAAVLGYRVRSLESTDPPSGSSQPRRGDSR